AYAGRAQCRRQSVSTGRRSRRWEPLPPCEGRAPPPQESRPSSRSLHLGDGARRTAATEMVSSLGAASHLLATHTLSSPFLHRLLRDETAFQLVNKTIVGKSHLSLAETSQAR